MFVNNPNLGADPNLGDFTVIIIIFIKIRIHCRRIIHKIRKKLKISYLSRNKTNWNY